MTKEVQANLEKICQVILETVPAVQIYLFGSYAYGEPHADSDYDIYVVLADDGPRPLDAMFEISVALSDNIAMPMDILALKESRFNYRLGAPTLENTVYQKGVLLYDRSGGARQRMV